MFLYKQRRGGSCGFLIALLPALFMTMVSVSSIFIAPEGFHLAPAYWWIGYAAAVLTTLSCLLGFLFWMRKQNEVNEVKHTK